MPDVTVAAAKPKKKLPMLIVALVGAIVLSGGATYFLMARSHPAASESTKHEEPKEQPIGYFPLEQSITANVAGSDAFVQTSVTFGVAATAEELEFLKLNEPAARATVLSVVADQKLEQIDNAAGRTQLAAAIKKAVNDMLGREGGRPIVRRVYFTSFVIQ